MTLLVLLAMLATWRITNMLQDENGPYGVFARLQAWVARKPDTPGSFSDGFFCFYCLSLYVALPFALLLSFNKYFILYWAAVSTGAIIIHHFLETLKSSEK